MKKSNFKKVLLGFSSFAFIAIFASCSNFLSEKTASGKGGQNSFPSESENSSFGSAQVSMFIPNYNSSGNSSSAENSNFVSRAVAPQTVSVRFAYNSTGEFKYLEDIDLSKAEKTAVCEESSELNLAGYNYTFTFSEIPCGTYAQGMLEIQLLNSSGNVISKGSNSKTVEVLEDSVASASFYTIPVNSDAQSSSLSNGEMKFFKVQVKGGKKICAYVEVGENDVFPEIVIFAANGTFQKHLELSAENPSFCFEILENTVRYYIGIWANGKNISSYSIRLEELEHKTGSVQALIDSGESYFCLNCGTAYETQEESENCALEIDCPKYALCLNCKTEYASKAEAEICSKSEGCPKFVNLEGLVAGDYEMNVSSGFVVQKANADVQVVNNIAVSARIDQDYVVLKLSGGVQQGSVKFKLEKAMNFCATEILGNNQSALYGIAISSADGTATLNGEKVSLDSLPSTKNGSVDISNKILTLSAGTYELGAASSGNNVKLSKLTFTEI